MSISKDKTEFKTLAERFKKGFLLTSGMTKYIFDGEGVLYEPILSNILREYCSEPKIMKAFFKNAVGVVEYSSKRVIELFTNNRLFFDDKFLTYYNITEALVNELSDFEKNSFCEKYIMTARVKYVLRKFPEDADLNIVTNGVSTIVSKALAGRFSVFTSNDKVETISALSKHSDKIIFIYEGLNDRNVAKLKNVEAIAVEPINYLASQIGCGTPKEKKPFRETIDSLIE